MTASTPTPRRQIVNIQRRIIVAALLLLLIFVSLTFVMWESARSGTGDELSGNVLLWHALSGDGVATLETMLNDFEELNPRTTVYQQPFESKDELLAQYRETVDSGLGPDLILGDAAWIPTLAQEESIRPIDDQIDPTLLEQYLPASIASLTYDEQVYGLPLSLRVPALYYNSKLVETPAESLDALLTQAAEGKTVLIGTSFRDALWGIQAFGGRFFDDEGRIILDRGGYANWLDWLISARSAPGMILDSNRESLRERFLKGDAAYYVGYPDEIDTLLSRLGEDSLGVAPLPNGPTGSAGPLLGVDALLFSPVSSVNQRTVGVALAAYLTNSEQSAQFMRAARLIPANSAVRINPRLYPLMAAFLTQARSAVALPNLETLNQIWSIAGNAYSRAMSGVSSPLEAASETTLAINELNGFEATPQAEQLCTYLGTLRLAHDWEGSEADVLDAIIEEFRTVCPLVIVKSEYANLDDVRADWAQNPTAATNPDIVLASQEWMISALQDEIALKDITAEVSGETLQRYLPASVAGMREGIQLHGLPMSVRVHVLYYNRSLTDDPASLLDQLRMQASSGLPITLDAQFARAYWGIGAFGGHLLDTHGAPALDEGGFADWLAWLRQSESEFGINLVFDGDEAKNEFLAGESAYYVGEPIERAELAAALSEENLGITLLPAGPDGDATPLFMASGLLFSDAMNDAKLAMALGFALYATNADNQTMLTEMTERVPANATVDPDGKRHIQTYLEQARTAYPLPNDPQIRDVLELGDEAYAAVLVDGANPTETANALNQAISALYGFVDEVEAPDTETADTGKDGAESVATPETDATPEGASEAETDLGDSSRQETAGEPDEQASAQAEQTQN